MGYKPQNQTISFADPTLDARVPLAYAPADGGGLSVVAARAMVPALAQGDTNVISFQLVKGSTVAGAATAVTAPLHNGNTGGAAWVANTPREFTMIAGVSLDPGEWLVAVYDETGTVAPTNGFINIDTVAGKR